MPCTTILVGKKASYDGSTIVAETDSANGEFSPKRFCVVDPRDAPATPRRSRTSVPHLPTEDGVRPYGRPQRRPSPRASGRREASRHDGVAMSATETLTSNERVWARTPWSSDQPAKGTPGSDDFEPKQPGGIGEEDMVTLVLPYARSARDGVHPRQAPRALHGTYEMNSIAAFSDVNEIWWLKPWAAITGCQARARQLLRHDAQPAGD